MSIIRYNGVTLPYATITQFRQEALYDEVGGTDWYLTKFDVRVVCTINANYLGMVYPDLRGETDNAALIMSAVRTTLLQPRKPLSVSFNGYELTPDVQGNNLGTVDAMNGPQPQSCNIVQLNNVTFLVDFHIIAHYWENNSVNINTDPPVQNFNGNNVLYNRWTETQELDACQFSTYVRDGKFMIRSDNKDGFTADQARRQMAAVGLRPGFLRKSSKYTVAPDGLALQYRIADQEVFRKPPPPAFEAEGDYTETVAWNQPYRVGECRVVLRGDKLTPQVQLINVAVGLASAKVVARSTQLGAQFGVISSGFLRQSLFKNEVECIVTATFAATHDRLAGANNTANGNNGSQRIAAFVGMNTSVAGSDPNYQPPYLLHGTANFLLQAAAYYDPSLTNTVMDQTSNQMSTGLSPGQAGRSPEE